MNCWLTRTVTYSIWHNRRLSKNSGGKCVNEDEEQEAADRPSGKSALVRCTRGRPRREGWKCGENKVKKKKMCEIPRSSGGSARGRTVGDGGGAAHDATSSITVSWQRGELHAQPHIHPSDHFILRRVTNTITSFSDGLYRRWNVLLSWGFFF